AQLRNGSVLTGLEELRGEGVVATQAMEGLADMGQIEIAFLIFLYRDRVALSALRMNVVQRCCDTLYPGLYRLSRCQLLYLQHRGEDHRLQDLGRIAPVQTFHDRVGAVILLHDGFQCVTRDGGRLGIDVQTGTFQGYMVLVSCQL